MFTTVTEVKELTGYDVDETLLKQAQAIIESYVGRIEVEITDARDLMHLGRAAAYQSAYMLNDPIKIFEQMSVAQLSQFGANVSFKSGDTVSPWVAPLAVMACNKLSWKRMRSVKTGNIYGHNAPLSTWRTD